ncbi:hypothetical protein AGMMS50276_32040 [Synergistales bacterium]|nr:hypothetical protein AGMMS50276_32040 [Synergistales bacterium]
MGAGYDSVDMSAAKKKNIAVTITPGANAEAVAEYAFTLMLALSRGLVQTDKRIRNSDWKLFIGNSLAGKKLGVVGLGNIGKILCRHAINFSMEILAYDEYKDEDYAVKNGISYCSLEKLIRESNFVSLHVPLNDNTRKMFSTKEFNMMKPSAYIINCARGGVIDEDALYEALKNDVIRGAGLDVFGKEPLAAESCLRTLDNVILSSHTAGSTVESREKVFEIAVRNVIDYFEGRVPKGIVNPE